MKIAVIGTGNVGSALGGSLARAGHDVTFAARDAAKAAQVAEQAGGSTAHDPAAAVSGADVVVLAVPFTALADVAAELAPVIGGKVVIDPTNPLNADYSGLTTAGGPSGAERLATLLPGANVVKAFNTLFATVQADAEALGTTVDALIAADDPSAAETVDALATSIGFRPVNVGPLAAARELEALAFLNIRLQVIAGGAWQTSVVLVSPPDAALAA
jgi:NADPH-dependent F420 reductase